VAEARKSAVLIDRCPVKRDAVRFYAGERQNSCSSLNRVPAIRTSFTAEGVDALLRSLREAAVTMLAVVATLLCALTIDPGPGPAVLAVVLCISLSRSQLDRDSRGRVEAAIVLPLVGLVAVGVGMLLHRVPWLGAVVFITGMFLSIWLRRFGPMARRAGSLIALPFVALLTVPYIPPTPHSPIPGALAPVIIALLAHP